MTDVITLDCIKRLREWCNRTPEERCAAGEHNWVPLNACAVTKRVYFMCVWCHKHEEVDMDGIWIPPEDDDAEEV